MDGDVIEIPGSQSTDLLLFTLISSSRTISVPMCAFEEGNKREREYIRSYSVKSSILQGSMCQTKTSSHSLTITQRIGAYTVTSHCLGSGSFATVNLALDTSQYRQVACKSIKTRKDENISKVMKEVHLLKSLNHVSEVFRTLILTSDEGSWAQIAEYQ